MFTTAHITCPHCTKTFDFSMSPYDELAEIPCNCCKQPILKKEGDHCAICSHGDMVCLVQQCKRDCCSG